MQEKQIILTRICSLYKKCNLIKRKNGEYREILRCSGLDKQYEENCLYLEPYSYNQGYARTFENDNDQYNPYTGLDNIFSDLYEENNEKAIIELLSRLAENACYTIEDDSNVEEDSSLNELKRLYNLIGLEIETMMDDSYPGIYVISFKVSALNKALDCNDSNISAEKWLQKNYIEVYKSYISAFNSFINGDYGAAIESARSTLTGLFTQFKLVTEAKWLSGVANITQDAIGQSNEEKQKSMAEIKDEVEKFNRKDISEFFGENLNGKYKKTKAIYSIYSMMSDYGTHRNEGSVEIPSSEDSLMMIRMMTDIVVWIYQRQNK